MKCPNCGHEGTGKFCVKCGTPFEEAATASEAPSGRNTTFPIDQEQLNRHIESVKEVSRNYFNYFLTVFMHPYRRAAQIQGQQWVNGLITIVLYGLFIGLFTYVLLGDLRSMIASPFINFVLKPTIGHIVFLSLVAFFIFLAAKLMRVNWTFLDVYAEFGSLLVPFVALFLFALILALLQAKVFAVILLLLGMMIASFLTPALILTIHRQETGGLDRFYAIVVVYVLLFITTGILSELLLSALMDVVKGSIASFFNPFSRF